MNTSEKNMPLLEEVEVSELEDRIEFVAAGRCNGNGGGEKEQLQEVAAE